jgi:nucleoside-diphosphate-sugar epimerase
MTKVLITGGVGFIGYHLAKRLVSDGYQVDLVDNLARGVVDVDFEDLLQTAQINFIQADLLKPKVFEGFGRDYSYVYHLAAIIGVAHVFQRPFAVLLDNTLMLDHVIRLARRQDTLKRMVFTSTSEVYAGTLKHFSLPIPSPEATPLAITDLKQPRTSYMLSKIYGEALCHHSGLPYTIVRPHNFYGPRMGLAHVIPELLKRAYESASQGVLDVYSVSHRRTFCYIGDAVEMIKLVAEAPGGEGGTFNIGNQSPEVTMGELADLIIRIVGRPLSIAPQPETLGSPARRAPDMRKTMALTGYRARVGLEEGVRLTYSWYKDRIFNKKGLTAI